VLVSKNGGGISGSILARPLENRDEIGENREGGHESAKENRNWAIGNHFLEGRHVRGLVAVQHAHSLRRDRVEGAGSLDVHAQIVTKKHRGKLGLHAHEHPPNQSKEHDDIAHAHAVGDRRVKHVNHDECLEEAGGDVNEEEEALEG